MRAKDKQQWTASVLTSSAQRRSHCSTQCVFRTANTAISAYVRDALELTTYFQLVISLFILYIEHDDRSHLKQANKTKPNETKQKQQQNAVNGERDKERFIYLLIGKRLAMRFVCSLARFVFHFISSRFFSATVCRWLGIKNFVKLEKSHVYECNDCAIGTTTIKILCPKIIQ